MQNNIYDFTIVGAGIVGLSTAYKLSLAMPDAKILILEKEDRVAAHQTGKKFRSYTFRYLLQTGKLQGQKLYQWPSSTGRFL